MVKVVLWQVRQRMGLSLRDLEKLCGISDSALQRIEVGQVSPTLQQLDRIAEALDVKIEDLYRRYPSDTV